MIMGFSKSRKREQRISDKSCLEDVLRKYRDEIRLSEMFKCLCASLEPFRESIGKVRCLAIGSFHDDFPARYQLALLCELVEYFPGNVLVSIYDPIFTPEDCRYISSLHNWSVDQKAPIWKEDSVNTLFFLPHAPLELTEQVLDEECPHLWLANHAVAHTDRYTKLQLYQEYPVLSKLVYLLNSEILQEPKEEQTAKITTITTNADEFTKFVPKRKRKNKKVFQDVQLNYTVINSHFKSCKILQDFEQGALLKNQPWINSFSDLALHFLE